MATQSIPAAGGSAPVRPKRRTELDHYPSGGRRFLCLGIVVVATIVLYYQFYLAGAVAAGTEGKNGILVDYHMSFVYYVNIAVIGYVFGAIASSVTGVADKYGRVNIVTTGLVVVALLCLIGIPLADSKLGFGIVFVAIGLVEGVILVATPALIRDFSPQLGRASAMGFWTLGPVLGSLVVSIQISSTSNTTPWHNQYVAAGVVGLVVAAVSAVFLRELTPELRDQVMVSSRDRAMIEARAKGIDVEQSMRSPFRQMLKPNIVLSAFAISVFLIIYYIAVGFFPAFFQTVFGYTQSRANSLGNYIWAFNALALLIIGFASDRVRVRKPFMVVGAIGAIVMTTIFALKTTDANTSYATFAVILSLNAVFLGVAYAPWMASYTETVEERNPALTATGLAVWGLVIRIVIAVSVFIVPHVVNTVTTLVEKGPGVQAALDDPTLTDSQRSTVEAVVADPTIVPKVQTTAAKYKTELGTAAKLKPDTAAALGKNPNDVNAQIAALSELTNVAPADVATVVKGNLQHGPALQAATAIDPSTAQTLLTDSSNQQALQKAVGEITAAKKVSPAQAIALIKELKTIPIPDLLTIQANGPKVLAAAGQLQALGKVPPDQLALVAKYGPNLQNPQVQKDLLLLAKEGPGVKKAAADSPKQWQHYFWIAVGGEVVFIPLIFLLTGFWSPRKARRAEEEHEAWVEAEMAKLRT